MVKFQADLQRGPKLSTSDLGGSARSIATWGGGLLLVLYLLELARNRGVDTLNDLMPSALRSDGGSDPWSGW